MIGTNRTAIGTKIIEVAFSLFAFLVLGRHGTVLQAVGESMAGIGELN
jgi:hypothetical protein